MHKLVATIAISVVLATPPARAEPNLSGIWMLSGRVVEGELVMTDRALSIQAKYDLLEDDPSLKCEPASISRVWANPNVRIEIEQLADRVLVNYEFYDLRREILLGDLAAIADSPSTQNVDGVRFSKMGSSFANYEGDRLIIQTGNHSDGYIRTSRGIPQSDTTTATEVLYRDGDVLHLTLTYVDETLFKVPFVLTHEFSRTDDTMLPLYECTDADYDWFEELNAPMSGDSP